MARRAGQNDVTGRIRPAGRRLPDGAIGGICKPASWDGAPGSNHILSNRPYELIRARQKYLLEGRVDPLTRNTQTVIGHTNLCNKYGDPWTLAILALPDNLTFDLTHLIRMHIDGKI